MTALAMLERLGADPSFSIDNLSGAEVEQIMALKANSEEMNPVLIIAEPTDPSEDPEPEKRDSFII